MMAVGRMKQLFRRPFLSPQLQFDFEQMQKIAAADATSQATTQILRRT